MRKAFRVGVAAAGLVAVAGCARAPVVAAAPAFSLDTPVEKIAADGRGRAVLNRDLPGLMASSQYVLFEDMSLAQIATLSSGQLTKAKLGVVAVDLSSLGEAPQEVVAR
jgi:hypothetical protein